MSMFLQFPNLETPKIRIFDKRPYSTDSKAAATENWYTE